MTVTYLEQEKVTYRDAKKKELVRTIADECRRRGARWVDVVGYLNFLQIPTARGKQWTTNSLRPYIDL